jgi:beta-glucosidase
MMHKLFVMLIGVVAGASIAAAADPNPPIPAQSVHAKQWPSTAHAAVDAAAVDPFVEKLLSQLSLEEKVGQMIQADIASITPDELRQYKLGSILAGGNAAPGNNVRTTPKAWLDLTNDFYQASLDTGGTHQAIPILFGVDAVHGNAKIMGATIFPHNVGLGAAHDPDLIHRIGQATGVEVSTIGVDWTFAPTVAVARDVRWGRSYESYSEMPELVAQYAPAMVTGLQGERGTPDFMAPGHTLSSVKHFLGDGGTLAGRDQGNTIVTEAVLSHVHGAGYAPAIDAGAMIVMASYNSWNGAKLHGNHYLLTDILKGRMGFNGFVVGDWNAQEELPGCTKSNCAAAILAGVDMLMAPDGWQDLYRNTLAQAQSGEIPKDRIDDAVRRILRVKAAAGLFKRPAPKQRSDAGHFEQLGSAQHRAIAREAVRKSLVLLKNSQHVLPLSPKAHVLVAGAAANDIGMQSGGWTIDWQANHNSNVDFAGSTSIYAGIEAAVSRAGGSAVLSPDGHYKQKPDVAVVVFGEAPYAEFQGDRETLEYSPGNKSDLTLLRRLHAAGIPTVSVFISGRPLWVNPEMNASDAFVAAWLPGSEGEGIADVLFRAPDGSVPFDFAGRLAFSWPQTAMPVHFEAAGVVSGALYPDGYGLNYTDAPATAVAADAPLSEDPKIPAHFRAPNGSLFFASHPTAPWSMFVADGDAEVHVTTLHQASPHGAVSATLGKEGAAVAWDGSQSGMLRIAGRALDMGPPAAKGDTITVRYRVDQAPAGRVALGVRCTLPSCGTADGALLDVTQTFREAKIGAWNTLVVPVSCLKATGADLSSVEVPLAIETSGKFGVTVAQARLAARASSGQAPCPAPAAKAAVK